MTKIKNKAIVFVCTLVLFAVTAVSAGCFGETAQPPEVALDDLIGTWTYTKDGSGYVEVSFKKNMRYTKRDTTGGTGENSMGEFELDGNKVTLIPSEGTNKTVHEITAFDGDTMVWGSDSFAREYKKN